MENSKDLIHQIAALSQRNNLLFEKIATSQGRAKQSFQNDLNIQENNRTLDQDVEDKKTDVESCMDKSSKPSRVVTDSAHPLKQKDEHISSLHIDPRIIESPTSTHSYQHQGNGISSPILGNGLSLPGSATSSPIHNTSHIPFSFSSSLPTSPLASSGVQSSSLLKQGGGNQELSFSISRRANSRLNESDELIREFVTRQHELMKQVDSLTNKLKQEETKNAELTKRVSEKEQQFSTQKAKYKTLKNKHTRMRDVAEGKLRVDVEKHKEAKQKFRELEKFSEEAQSTNKILEAENKNLKEQLENLKSIIDVSEKAKPDNKTEQLEQELMKIHSQYREEIRNLNEKFKWYIETHKRLREENSQFQMQLQANSERNYDKTKLEALLAENASLQNEITKLKDSIQPKELEVKCNLNDIDDSFNQTLNSPSTTFVQSTQTIDTKQYIEESGILPDTEKMEALMDELQMYKKKYTFALEDKAVIQVLLEKKIKEISALKETVTSLKHSSSHSFQDATLKEVIRAQRKHQKESLQKIEILTEELQRFTKTQSFSNQEKSLSPKVTQDPSAFIQDTLKSLHELEERNSSLERELLKANSKLNLLQKQYSNAERKLKKLNLLYNEQKKMIKDQQSQIEEFQKKGSTNENTNEIYEKYNSIKREHVYLQQTLRSMEDSLDRSLEELKKERTDKSTYISKNIENEERILQLEGKINNYADELKSKSDIIDALTLDYQNNLQSKSNIINTLTEKCEEFEKSYKFEVESSQEIKNQLQEALQRNMNFEKEVAELKKSIDRLEGSSEMCDNELKQLHNLRNHDYEVLLKEKAVLKKSYAANLEHLERNHREALASLEQEKNDYLANAEELKKYNEKLKADIATILQSKSELESELQTLKIESEETKKHLSEENQAALLCKKEEIECFKEEKQLLVEEIKILHLENQHLKDMQTSQTAKIQSYEESEMELKEQLKSSVSEIEILNTKIKIFDEQMNKLQDINHSQSLKIELLEKSGVEQATRVWSSEAASKQEIQYLKDEIELLKSQHKLHIEELLNTKNEYMLTVALAGGDNTHKSVDVLNLELEISNLIKQLQEEKSQHNKIIENLRKEREEIEVNTKLVLQEKTELEAALKLAHQAQTDLENELTQARKELRVQEVRTNTLPVQTDSISFEEVLSNNRLVAQEPFYKDISLSNENENTELHLENERLNNELERLKEDANRKKQEISELKANQEYTITDYEKNLNDSNNRNITLLESISERDATIQKLQEKIRVLEIQLSDIQGQIESKPINSKIESLQNGEASNTSNIDIEQKHSFDYREPQLDYDTLSDLSFESSMSGHDSYFGKVFHNEDQNSLTTEGEDYITKQSNEGDENQNLVQCDEELNKTNSMHSDVKHPTLNIVETPSHFVHEESNPILPPPNGMLNDCTYNQEDASKIQNDSSSKLGILADAKDLNHTHNEYSISVGSPTSVPANTSPRRPTPQFPINDVKFSPTEEIFVVTAGSQITIYNSESKSIIKRLESKCEVAEKLAFSPDGMQFAVSGQGPRYMVSVWTNEGIGVLRFPNRSRITCLDFNPSNQSLITGSEFDFGIFIMGMKNVVRYPVSSGILSLSWSCKGDLLALAHVNGDIVIRDAVTLDSKTGQCAYHILSKINISPATPTCILWHSSEDRLVVCDSNRELTLYTFEVNKLLEQRRCPLDSIVHTMTFIDNGRYLCLSGDNHRVTFYTSNGDALHNVLQSNHIIRSIVEYRDFLVTTDDKKLVFSKKHDFLQLSD